MLLNRIESLSRMDKRAKQVNDKQANKNYIHKQPTIIFFIIKCFPHFYDVDDINFSLLN